MPRPVSGESIPRALLAEKIARAAGSGAVSVLEAGNGWPAEILVETSTGPQRVDLYVSRITSHSRMAYEVRFQNPGQDCPILVRPGVIPVLAGYAEVGGSSVCVVADAMKRVGGNQRFSVLFNSDLVDRGAHSGWAEYVSSSNEVIIALNPRLLGAFVELGEFVPVVSEREMSTAVRTSGVLVDETATTRRRVLSAVSRLTRDARFREDVKSAYDGKCGLCGLNWNLVDAAHIYPVEAPDSPDKVWNGVGLCGNHHRVFDGHLLHIEPDSLRVRFSDQLLARPTAQGRVFLDTTYSSLVPPANPLHRPRAEMLQQRYRWFKTQYAWVG